MNTSVELISIGSELLSGRTLNTHAQTLGTALSELGLQLSRDTTIPDELDLIQSAVRDAFERVDTVVVSGGLGPTPDDITKATICKFFNTIEKSHNHASLVPVLLQRLSSGLKQIHQCKEPPTAMQRVHNLCLCRYRLI